MRHPEHHYRDRLHGRGLPDLREGAPEWAFLAGIADLRDITWVDLPTSHWPMWSRPKELAAIIGDVAKGASRG